MTFFRKVYMAVRKKLFKIDDRTSFQKACDNGMTVGNDCRIQDGVLCDPSHSWLITMGDRVTLAPRVVLLAHDASTKSTLGYTMIGRINIGNDVFIGAGSIVLPCVSIGNNVIIGAGSVVSRSIPDNCIAAGNPCRVIKEYGAFIEERKKQMDASPLYDESFRVGSITSENKELMKEELTSSAGFVK